MNKNELVVAVAEKAGVEPLTAGAVITAFQQVVTAAVAAGEPVALTGFLTFEKVEKGATTGRNPATGAEIAIAARSLPKVKVGTAFKKAVNGS